MRDALTRVRAQVIKEMLSITRDRRIRFIIVGPPILQLLVFAYAITMELRNVDMGVYDQDGGVYAQQLYDALDQSTLTNRVEYRKRLQPLQQQLEAGKLLFVVVVPEHFSADLNRHKPAKIQVLFDGRRANSSQLAFAYVSSIVKNTFGPVDLWKKDVVMLRHAYNPNLSYVWFMTPGLSGLLMMLLALLLTALSIAREREMGTFEQLMVSPLTRGEIVIAKALPPLIVSCVVSAFMLTIIIFFFKVPFRGSLWLLVSTVLLTALGGIGIGLMFSAVCATQQQAVLSAFGVLVFSTLLSGFLTPVENMVPLTRWISSLLPLTHYQVVLRAVFLKGPDATGLWRELIPLVIFAFVTLALAVGLLRRKLS